MARMTLSYEDLYTRVSNFLALTTTGTAPTGTNLTTCKNLVHRGIRQFLYPLDARYGSPHEWSFLKQPWSFTTVSGQWKYTVPIDFSDLLTDFTFDDDNALGSLRKVSGQQIKKMRTRVTTSGWPHYFALVPQRYDVEIGTTYQLWLYPTPSQAYLLSSFYRPDPIKLAATIDLVIGGIMVIEAVLESCLAVAEIQEEDNTSTHHQAEANRLTQTAIRFDSGKTDTQTIGNMHTSKMRRMGMFNPFNAWRAQEVDYEADVYADDR